MQYAIVTQLKYGKLEIQTTFGSRQKMTLAIFLALKAGLVFLILLLFSKASAFSDAAKALSWTDFITIHVHVCASYLQVV